jgi:hypothetical protein
MSAWLQQKINLFLKVPDFGITFARKMMSNIKLFKIALKKFGGKKHFVQLVLF